jgi:hypothetical protein
MLVNVADHTENHIMPQIGDTMHYTRYKKTLSLQPDDWLVEQGEDPIEMKTQS